MIVRGLGALPDLAPAKAHLVRRLVLAGGVADPQVFAARGLRLASREAERLADWSAAGLETTVVDEVRSRDGSQRLVIELADGERVEAVVMADDSVCVSTQVGCAVGCRFCASGIDGLSRNLAAHEILEQVVHARGRRTGIDRVVFMGVGEPTHNLDAVIEVVQLLVEDGGIPARRQTLSTVGSVRALQRLARSPVYPTLALSLHAADDELRQELIPWAGREPVADLVAAAEQYGRATARPVQYAWALLAGVNDRDTDVDALARLLDGAAGYVNLIPYNRVDELHFVRPATDRAIGMARELRRRGILATVRWSVGAEAEAACGQLRRRRGSSR